MVIDDEQAVRNVMRRILERAGFRVILKEDGASGVEAYRQQQGEILVIILDVTMPHMGGEETFRRLRQINPDVKVIVSSGYTEREGHRALRRQAHRRVRREAVHPGAPHRAGARDPRVEEVASSKSWNWKTVELDPRAGQAEACPSADVARHLHVQRGQNRPEARLVRAHRGLLHGAPARLRRAQRRARRAQRRLHAAERGAVSLEDDALVPVDQHAVLEVGRGRRARGPRARDRDPCARGRRRCRGGRRGPRPARGSGPRRDPA